MGNGTKQKKRQYSRAGCKECKRRKLKCDEAKPECWQCSRLGKKCVYMKLIKFSESRNIFMMSNYKEKQDEELKTSEKPNVQFQVVKFDEGDKAAQRPRTPKILVEQEEPVHLDEFIPQNISPGVERDTIINEASNLAHDIFESIENVPDFIFDDFINIDLTLSDFEKKQNIIDSFDLREPHKAHLEVFYDKISAWLFPLDPTLCNEILLYHAKNSSYLLASMLSLATEDQDLKKKYISTCLQNLNQVFQDTQTNILNNIEPLLLTVLLLAADSTSMSWRAHLRGAKDLFLKYTKYYQTPSLLFARSWFAAVEILANLQSIGTVKNHDEFDELLDVGLYGKDSEFAIEVGILLPDGYNMFLGYSSEAIVMYREFFKLRKDDSNGLLFQMSLIHNAKECQIVSNEIVVKEDNPAHPNYPSEEERLVFPGSCYGFKGDTVFSWFDLIHQIHVDALLLKMYTEHLQLDKRSSLVQRLVKQMLDLCVFYEGEALIDGKDTRLLMCQGAFLTIGLNCVDDLHKSMVENYFQGLMELGVNSAKVFFQRIKNVWMGKEDGDVTVVPFA